MCAATVPTARVTRLDETLEGVLNTSHNGWLEEARRILVPGTAPDAAFWDRWVMVRYLNEGFLRRFRMERALVRELRPLITVREMTMLEAGGEQVARLHLELELLSRRRPTTAEFAAVTEGLLEGLGLWCAEIELASRDVRVATLPAEARRALQLMEPLGYTLRRF